MSVEPSIAPTTVPATITATLRLEIVKPLGNVTWDELGTAFRALRAPLHRAMNSAISELELMASAQKHGVPANHWDGLVKPRKPRIPGEHAHPKSICYQLLSRAWEAERAEAAARVEAKKPYNGDAVVATLTPASSLVRGAANAAYERWKKWSKERWKGTMSLPSFNKEQPLYVSRSDATDVSLRVEDGSYILKFKLLSRKGAWTSVNVVVRPSDGSGFAQLRQIVDGLTAPADAPTGVTLGDCRIVQATKGPRRDRAIDNAKRPHKKWFAMISWTRPVAKVVAGGRTMALHRGIRTFLAVAIAAKDDKRALSFAFDDGGDILEHKERYRARRRSLGRHGKALGTGARGHGVDRRHERITRIEDAEACWIRTRCQQTAARVVALVQKHNVTRVLLEEYGNPAKEGTPKLNEHIEYLVRSFPMAQLRDCIVWALQKIGVEVVLKDCAWNSQRCPMCRTLNDVGAAYTYECTHCNLQRNVDLVNVWNMLIDEGFTSLVEDHNKQRNDAVNKLLAMAPAP